MRLLLMVALVPASLITLAAASPDPLEALVQDSPFLPPPGAARATAVAEGGPLEFRSVVFERGQFAFSIYDQGSKQSKWVKLGPGEAPFTARSYDREHDILTVDYQGRSVALKLQEGHIVGQAPPGSVPAPAPLPSAAESARQNPAANNTSSPPGNVNPQESQRLQNMADEIRRRRQPLQSPPLPKK